MVKVNTKTLLEPTLPVRARTIRLNPDKAIKEPVAKKIVDAIQRDCFFCLAVPFEKITLLGFHPPSPRLPEIELDKVELSKVLSEANIKHSYMTMAEKLKRLSVPKLKRLCERVGIATRKECKDKLARMLWVRVEIAEQGKPANLSATEIASILKERKVKAWKKPLKERFAKLSYKYLLEIATKKRVEIPLSLVDKKVAKEELLEAIWEAKESYDYRLKLYKSRRYLQEVKPMRTKRGILDYCSLREDIASAGIKELRVRLEPFTFFCKELVYSGHSEEFFFFHALPTISKASYTKY